MELMETDIHSARARVCVYVCVKHEGDIKWVDVGRDRLTLLLMANGGVGFTDRPRPLLLVSSLPSLPTDQTLAPLKRSRSIFHCRPQTRTTRVPQPGSGQEVETEAALKLHPITEQLRQQRGGISSSE